MATKTKKTTAANRLNGDGDLSTLKETKESERLKITIAEFETQIIRIKIVGDSPLIVNRFKDKTIKQLADKHAGVASAGREKKDAQADYQGSLYMHPDGGYGFPCSGFNNAAVSACTSLGKSVITHTQARQAFRVMGDMVKIEGKPHMRQDIVRVGKFGNRQPDVRYRAEFSQWSCTLTIRFNARVLSGSEVVNLFQCAGFAVGVGEWRPEKNGQFGMFHVQLG